MAKKHDCLLSSGQIAAINAALLRGDRVEVIPSPEEHPKIYIVRRDRLQEAEK